MVGTRATTGPGGLIGSKPKTPTTLGLSLSLHAMKERLADLEGLVGQLVNRVTVLETENCELKSKCASLSHIPSSPVQQFMTPLPTVIRHHVPPKSIPMQQDFLNGEPSLEEADVPDEGEWVTVVNKRNKIVKKYWKANNNNIEIPVGKNANYKSQKATQNNRNNNRNFNRNNGRRRNSNRNFNSNDRSNHGNSGQLGNNYQFGQLLNGLSNFLMLQTRQQMPIYQNRFF